MNKPALLPVQLNLHDGYTAFVNRWSRTNARRFTAVGDHESASIYLYDVIGQYIDGGVSALQFQKSLDDLGDVKAITLYVNSPGGDVSDGVAIYNAIARHPAHVTTYVTGMAASAASFIVQAGDERVMADSTTLMIHNAHGFTMGDHRDHAATASTLQLLDGQIADMYARRSGRQSSAFRALMEKESYFDAAGALKEKLIDRVAPGKTANKSARSDIDAKLAMIASDNARLAHV